VFALAVVAAGCGRQITPSPKTTDFSGKIQVLFQTNGPLDFSDYTYAIAIDTCNNGVPYPQAAFTNYTSYSYVFFIGGSFGTTEPELYEYYFANSNITRVPVSNLNPSTTQFIPNYNGQGTEFEFIFERSDLYNPLNIAQPCPNITVAPASSPSASASLVLSASPLPAASGSASPVATSSPVPSSACDCPARDCEGAPVRRSGANRSFGRRKTSVRTAE